MADKRSQRLRALAARRNLPATCREAYSQQICQHLADLPEMRGVRTILAYAASEDEADVSAFCRRAAEQGVRVAYPVSYPGGRMEARVPLDAESWERGRFGLLQPRTDRSALLAPEETDAVLIPCVAFDSACRRLGHGAGYYDRYLPQCRRARRIAVAFEAQKLAAVSVDDHDVPMQLVVTEQGVYRPAEPQG